MIGLVAGPASAASNSWQTVTGNVQWSCNGQVETWDTWQAQYVDGQATGATADFQSHAAGTCPSGSSVTWQTVTGNIAWPCSGVETWETWLAEYVSGQATGATRDFQDFVSGSCSSGGSSGTNGHPAGSGAASSPSSTAPTAVTLPLPPSSMSVGPADGDFVAAAGNNSCYVVRAGQLTKTIPTCGWIGWVPGGDWIVYNQVTAPPDLTPSGYYALNLTGGSPSALPCAAGVPANVQPLRGPAVVYRCGADLDILRLGSGAQPKVYSGLPLPNMAVNAFAVDPTQTYIAVTTPQGWVNVYRLADGTQLPGTYMAGNPEGMAWSSNGILAIDSSEGLTVWHPGVSVFSLGAPANDNLLTWLPNNSGVLAISGLQPASPPAGYLVTTSGGMQEVAPAQSGVVSFGFTSDGNYYWHGPQSIGSGPYTVTASARG